MGLGTYAVMPIPGSLAWAWFLGTVVEAVVAGMLVGLIFTFSYIVFFKFISPELNTAEHWWFGVSPEGIGTFGMVLNFIVAFAVSRVTAPPPEHIQHIVEDIRIPRGAGEAHAH